MKVLFCNPNPNNGTFEVELKSNDYSALLELTISYISPVDNEVSLTVLNAKGVTIATLYEGSVVGEQEYNFVFNKGNHLASGVYFYRLTTADGRSAVNKLILIK
ncbi:MAG: hypothetical protein R2730_03510 [Chitinophagales bacterium]